MRETHARRACDDASRLEASGPGRQLLRQIHEQVGRLAGFFQAPFDTRAGLAMGT